MKFYKGQYAIVKYIPDLLKNEPINIGLIVYSSDEKYIKCEFATNKIEIISKYNQEIDMKIVSSIIEDLRDKFNSANVILKNIDFKSFFKLNLLEEIYKTHSNQVQFSNPKGFITVDLEDEFKRIFEEMIYKEKIIKNVTK